MTEKFRVMEPEEVQERIKSLEGKLVWFTYIREEDEEDPKCKQPLVNRPEAFRHGFNKLLI